MNRRTVTIKVNKGYDVIIENGILPNCGKIVKETAGDCRIAVIADSNVANLYLKTVLSSLAEEKLQTEHYIFDAGEKSKTISTLADILEFLADKKLSRSDTVIALGGGVTGDIAGFAASVYLRGVKFIQIPTTLLSAVDSSVGGKTAVDLNAGKNLAGTFKQPDAVICDPKTLSTLSEKEFSNGLAEAIKYGVLFSEELFEYFENDRLEDNLDEIIEKCVAFKGKIIEKDEFDTGERKLLNLGHTIGHAIEKCSNYTISHGFAVASGMAMAARAGEKMGITQAGTAEAIEKALEKYSLPTDTSFDPCSLASCALSDKKRAGETITAVIPERIGKCRLHGISVGELEDFIKKGKKQ
jgi:3-dehydroquinate synthase